MNQSEKTISTPINCQGITIRTTNADEMTAGNANSTAKIGSLWQNFQSSFCDSLDEKMDESVNTSSQVFGIYHNYESDVNGAFDVTACIADLQATDNSYNNSHSMVTIPTGNYLVFRKTGEMPQAVIDAWGDVWTYFNNGNSQSECQHTRKYDTDFEKYIGMDTVEVYIGVK